MGKSWKVVRASIYKLKTFIQITCVCVLFLQDECKRVKSNCTYSSHTWNSFKSSMLCSLYLKCMLGLRCPQWAICPFAHFYFNPPNAHHSFAQFLSYFSLHLFLSTSFSPRTQWMRWKKNRRFTESTCTLTHKQIVFVIHLLVFINFDIFISLLFVLLFKPYKRWQKKNRTSYNKYSICGTDSRYSAYTYDW